MTVVIVALGSNGHIGSSLLPNVTVATGEDVILSKTVTIEEHNNDERFSNIVDESLYKQITKYLLLKSPSVAKIAPISRFIGPFCSSSESCHLRSNEFSEIHVVGCAPANPASNLFEKQ
jgi:hypothetical protein